jgi:glucoamylase
VNPNYYYSWIRDSSLVFKLIIDTFVAGQTSLRPLVDDFTTASQHLQGVANPSGGVASGNNLGEPKVRLTLSLSLRLGKLNCTDSST